MIEALEDSRSLSSRPVAEQGYGKIGMLLAYGGTKRGSQAPFIRSRALLLRTGASRRTATG
ncbi:MAG: hypothetical protein AVDCRST_MAG37-651 [uncultured Rubrobacteraceae bacterium]|uniref:Uncharacterized protein n=1 Tax=uncultured Rubrobacteraceae bacterium TaxID=349277 RepID=A0A6J4Q1B5_9ACTN|nr:MAG: hypothetical protein AVDCRST_MAG37-651 [uncultured Rubrobacteraceae bacterium]